MLDPTSCEGLAAAGLLEADALLLAPNEASRSSAAEADAHVLGTMVEVQRLLAQGQGFHGQGTGARQLNRWHTMTSGRFNRNSSLGRSKGAVADAGSSTGLDQSVAEGGAAGPVCRLHKLHVVACVGTIAARAVAASFFGGVSSSLASAAGAGDASSKSSIGAVVGRCPFTYELIVEGEVESAVLLQVANEPLYAQFVYEVLGSSEGSELYMLDPRLFGFMAGEVVRFAEAQEVGRLLKKTVIGVVTGGAVMLAPGEGWMWRVGDQDKVATLATTW